jgi:hypothetical protein
MKVRVSELQGAELDWAVAKCEGVSVEVSNGGWWVFDSHAFPKFSDDYNESKWQAFHPSIHWAQGGPIIERERIDVMWCGDRWCVYTMTPDKELQLQTEGATPLLAAMRGYVASKLGFEVEIPEEVMGR